MKYLREPVIKLNFHNYSPATYLTNESENIETAYADKEAPWGSKHSESVKLSEKHDVHHETAHYHKCKFGSFVFCKEIVQTRCKIKNPIFNALNGVCN